MREPQRLPDNRPPRDMRAAPPSSAKTADDLKAILRSTLAKANNDKEKKEVKKQDSLKDALAQAVGNKASEPAKAPTPTLPAPNATFEVPENVLKDIFKETL